MGFGITVRSFFGSLTTLHWTLGLSAAIHAVLLTVHFVDPQAFNRILEDSALDVILVNAKSSQTPDKAQAIAQFSLAGGGDADKGRATTPLPYSASTNIGDAMDEEQRRLDAEEEQQALMLEQVRKQLAALPPSDPHLNTTDPQRQAEEEKRQQRLKLLAEIERRIREENARPKKRYISPSTMEGVQAIYYDNLRQRIEEKGTNNFPEAGGKKLYGELTMIMTINYDGRVVSTEVAVSSGNRQLDRRAEAIVRSAGPFGAFGPELRRKADQLALVASFKFNRNDTFEAEFQ